MDNLKKNIKKIGLVPVIIALIALFIAIFTSISFKSDVIYNGWLGWLESFFANSIQALSKIFGGSYGIGIISFTVLIRLILLPLMIYQIMSMKNLQKIQPELKDLQNKYKGKRDTVSLQKMQSVQKKLYKQADANPFASMIPLLVQIPVLFALYASISKTEALKTGHFLWVELGQSDPTFILPILAALGTFLSSWMSMQANPNSDQAGMLKTMTYIFPVIIFFTSFSVPSALVLYWVTSNIFQVIQTYFLQNPFEVRKNLRIEKEKEAKIRKNQRKIKNKLKKRS